MGLQKTIEGPYGIELNYHKINRIIQYFDQSGLSCIQVGSYRSREESQQDEAEAIKVHHFDFPQPVNGATTVDDIRSLAYSEVKENPLWSDAEDVLEEETEDE